MEITRATGVTQLPWTGIAVVALVALFIIFDGYLLAGGGVRTRSRQSRFVLNSFETHLLWTLVPVFLIMFLIRLPSDVPKRTQANRHAEIADPVERVPQSTKVLFE